MSRSFALLSLAVIVPSVGVAAPRPRVLVTCADCQGDSLVRLKSELRFVALDPVDVARPSQSDPLAPTWITNTLRALDTQALVDVTKEAAQVHVLKASGGPQTEVVLIRPEERWDTQIAELLRARFLPMPMPVPAPVPKAGPQEVARIERSPARPRHAFGLWLGPGMTFSPGGVGRFGQIWLVPSLSVRSWLELEMAMVGPVSAGNTTSLEGSADLRVGMATLGARFILAKEGWAVRPSVGIGAGIGLAKIEGSAKAPLLGQSGWVITSLVTADAGLAIVLPWQLWLQLDVRAGVAMPRPAVDFAGRLAATWGRPFVATVLGFGIRL